MAITEQLRNIQEIKFAFGKQHQYLFEFSKAANAFSMFDNGYGLGISNLLFPENQLRGVLIEIQRRGGYFAFNVNDVNLERASEGFHDYDEAASNDMITEWELSMIITEDEYCKRTIFHHRIVELPQVNYGIQFLWKQSTGSRI